MLNIYLYIIEIDDLVFFAYLCSMYIFNIKIVLVIIHVWYNFASNENYLESERDRNEVM